MREMQIAFLPMLIRHEEDYPSSMDARVGSTIRLLSRLRLFGWDEKVRSAAAEGLVTVEKLWDLHQVQWLAGRERDSEAYEEREAKLLSLVDENLPASRRALREAVTSTIDV